MFRQMKGAKESLTLREGFIGYINGFLYLAPVRIEHDTGRKIEDITVLFMCAYANNGCIPVIRMFRYISREFIPAYINHGNIRMIIRHTRNHDRAALCLYNACNGVKSAGQIQVMYIHIVDYRYFFTAICQACLL